MKSADLFPQLSRARIDAVLAEPVPEVKIPQYPLREVLAELKTLTGIDIYFDQEELGDVIDPDFPIDVAVAENSMTFKTLIEDFILAPNDLVYVIRDNHLVIMSYDKHLTTPDAAQLVLYNCRDLLVGIPVQPAHEVQRGVSGGEGAKSPDGETVDPEENAPATRNENLHQIGMGNGFGGGGFGQGAATPKSEQEAFSDIGAREQQLVELIRLTVRHEDYPWTDGSNRNFQYGGTIQAFNGMLVVRTLPEMHEQIRQLLRLLRESAKEQAWPADLGDWPHKKRIAPAKGEEPHPAGSGYF
jgi:hypothetical protein